MLYLPSKRRGGLGHLLELHHTRELSVWNAAYDARGNWSDSHAEAAAESSETAPKKRRKAYKAPAE